MKLSFCFPACNEEENIASSIHKAQEVCQTFFDDYEIIITDDGSTDKTAEIVTELAKANPKIKLIRQENQGYGGSVWTALSNASHELVFFTDADLQFDLSELSKLLAFIDEYDVVIGYRSPRVDPFMRLANAWAWNKLGYLIFRLPIRDVDCAFKLLKRSALDGLEVKSRGATFSLELLWRLKNKHLKIKEVPVKHFPRKAGRATGANLKVIRRAFRELRPLVREKRRLKSKQR